LDNERKFDPVILIKILKAFLKILNNNKK